MKRKSKKTLYVIAGAPDLGGAIGGGVVTYTTDGAQKVAVAAGFTHPAWPTKIVTAKIVVLGLDSASAPR
jgi:hypothetical protein